MRSYLNLVWIRRTAIILLISMLIVSIFIGVRTAVDVSRYSKSISGSGSVELTLERARNLNRDIDQIMTVLDLPVIKQATQLFGLDFVTLREEVKSIVNAAPILAGADSPKLYLVSFQNSAEARGTGGILGAYALIKIDKGAITILRTGSNEALYGMSLKKIPIQVPDEFKRLYGENPAILQNSNLSPHFPYGAEIWLGLWEKKFNQQLDGVIAIDPSALSKVLKSTGPITLESGQVINSENVVSETLEVAYKKFENDNYARKQYLVDIINATAAKLVNGEYSKIEMAKAIRDGIIANRILIYSTDKHAQKELSRVRLGGFMRTEPNNEFRTVIQNTDAGKLDYYLDRSVIIESKSCDKVRETQVRIRVTNTLKSANGLSAYVLTRADKGKPDSLIPGSHRFKVFIYGPTESKLVSVSRENRTADLGGGSTERKRPIYVADVDLAPGASEELLANFSGGVGSITYIDQPLVRETSLTVNDKC